MPLGSTAACVARQRARPLLEELEARLVPTLPYPDHIVIVIEENHSYSQIINSSSAPYINSLAQNGAMFTSAYAIEHPSEPNYLDLFSGSNQGVTDDSCPHTFFTPDLGGELEANGYSFGAYSEDLPAVDSGVCESGAYARKHAPWTNFTDLSPGDQMPFSYFPSDFTTLPTVSFVVPNLNNDIHDGSVRQGDNWLANNIDPYVQWSFNNNSLLIVTFDEDNGSEGNRIATLFVGPMVVPGAYDEYIDHFAVLRTVEDIYGLPYAGQEANYDPIQDVWVDGGGGFPNPRGHASRPAGDPATLGQAIRVTPATSLKGEPIADPGRLPSVSEITAPASRQDIAIGERHNRIGTDSVTRSRLVPKITNPATLEAGLLASAAISDPLLG